MRIDIIICGWHFKNKNIYHQLKTESEYYNDLLFKFFIASHKRQEDIDKNVLNSIIQLGWKVLYFENHGWEWGAYQQFLIWQKNNNTSSDYYLFLHDDIVIKKYGFIKRFIEKIQNSYSVVGNSVPINRRENVKLNYPEDILWAKLNEFPIISNEWDLVRGSCFFTTKKVVENILIKMPIKKGNNINFANCSLRVFGGLVCDKFGDNSITYIGGKPRSSIYIEEEYRANNHKERIKSLIRPYINKSTIKRILRLKKVAPIKRGNGLKINLGCGTECLYGYFNIDIDSQCADMKANILDVEFEKNTIVEVLMVHVIEHIDYLKVAPLLKKIFTWLKLNGQLIIEFPDLIKCCKLILKMKKNPEELENSFSGVKGIFGDSTKSAYQSHKWGWTKTTMVPLLKKIGFRETYVERTEYHVPKRDTRIVAVK